MNTSCNYCNYSCNYCYYCYYCRHCHYSRNLKMSENQIFCWSEEYGDSKSKQQKDFRVFNTQVTKEVYRERHSFIRATIPNLKNLPLEEFWASLTDDQILKISQIPEFDEAGFEFITGRKVAKPKTGAELEIEMAIATLEQAGLIVDGKILVVSTRRN